MSMDALGQAYHEYLISKGFSKLLAEAETPRRCLGLARQVRGDKTLRLQALAKGIDLAVDADELRAVCRFVWGEETLMEAFMAKAGQTPDTEHDRYQQMKSFPLEFSYDLISERLGRDGNNYGVLKYLHALTSFWHDRAGHDDRGKLAPIIEGIQCRLIPLITDRSGINDFIRYSGKYPLALLKLAAKLPNEKEGSIRELDDLRGWLGHLVASLNKPNLTEIESDELEEAKALCVEVEARIEATMKHVLDTDDLQSMCLWSGMISFSQYGTDATKARMYEQIAPMMDFHLDEYVYTFPAALEVMRKCVYLYGTEAWNKAMKRALHLVRDSSDCVALTAFSLSQQPWVRYIAEMAFALASDVEEAKDAMGFVQSAFWPQMEASNQQGRRDFEEKRLYLVECRENEVITFEDRFIVIEFTPDGATRDQMVDELLQDILSEMCG